MNLKCNDIVEFKKNIYIIKQIINIEGVDKYILKNLLIDNDIVLTLNDILSDSDTQDLTIDILNEIEKEM